MKKLTLYVGLLLLSSAYAGGAGGLAQTPAVQTCPAKTYPADKVKCIWTTPAGTLKILANTEDYTTNLTAYNKAGRLLWQKREKLAVIIGIQAVDGVLVVETSNNGAGAILASKTALIPPELGGVTWVSGSPLFAQTADHTMLFTQASSQVPQVEDGLNFQRVTLRPKLSVTPIHLDPPTRPNCGEAQGFYDAFGQPTFEGRFISVKRRDNCGEFVTRFSWLGAPAVR